MGKAEGTAEEWHGHVTALTVAPNYRRLGLAKTMMDELERVTNAVYRGYFVDLYVRVSNEIAIGMYERLGYSVYRRVTDYYSGAKPGEADEDAYGLVPCPPSQGEERRGEEGAAAERLGMPQICGNLWHEIRSGKAFERMAETSKCFPKRSIENGVLARVQSR